MPRFLCVSALLAAIAVGSGCWSPSVTNPWSFEDPPAVVPAEGLARPPEPSRTVIAVADFENPTPSPLGWDDIGAEIAAALRRTLLNESGFDVRIHPPPSGSTPSPKPWSKAKAKRVSAAELGGVQYVLTGKVTDFHHTKELPKGIARWSVIMRKNEAVSAIEWKLVDVLENRVVAADHIYGVAKASGKNVERQYKNLHVSNYMFWSSPLGHASRKAIERTVNRIQEILPERSRRVILAKRLGIRKVEVDGGWVFGINEGETYYLYRQDETGAVVEPVLDPATLRPLSVKIDKAQKEKATGWLMGKLPLDVELGQIMLSSHAPGTPPVQSTLTSAADLHADDG
ncbi:MAG: CsgG/HfaB family protein [Planctomycetota bacterium]|jgi:curli biogenesis system outer membrane secretion channel CsgG